MIRTQIYLTSEEKKALAHMAKKTGKHQSELIREAIDVYLLKKKYNKKILEEMAGIWKDRKDIPEYDELRSSWDRG